MNVAVPTNEMQLNLPELGAILAKHFGLHEGLYDVVFEFRIASGMIGPNPNELLPGAMLGVSRISLSKTETVGPLTIDAKIVNPAKTRSKKPSE